MHSMYLSNRGGFDEFTKNKWSEINEKKKTGLGTRSIVNALGAGCILVIISINDNFHKIM